MNKTMEVVTEFINLFMAKLKGDTDTVTAIKHQRKSRSAIEGQVSALERKIQDQEDTVEEREEALLVAFVPVNTFPAAQDYINQLKNAKDSLESAKEVLEGLKASLAFFSGLLKKFEPVAPTESTDNTAA
jgi:phage-related tail protein